MKPDRDVINTRLARIEDCLGQLEPFSELSDWQFTARYDRYHEAKKIVAVALSTVAQIARHLQRRLDGKSDDPLDALVALGVVDASLGARLGHSVRLASTLSRAHFEEDRDILYGFIRSDLGDLAAFARAVTTYLDARERGD